MAVLVMATLTCSAAAQRTAREPTPAGPVVTRGPGKAVAADLVLTNGFVYTVEASQPTASAVVVRDGQILFVGSDAEALTHSGPETEVIDLGGRMAMPGAHDSHVHILEAFHAAGGTCYLPPGIPLQNYVPIIQACAPDQVGTNWVLGYGHSIYDLHMYM